MEASTFGGDHGAASTVCSDLVEASTFGGDHGAASTVCSYRVDVVDSGYEVTTFGRDS